MVSKIKLSVCILKGKKMACFGPNSYCSKILSSGSQECFGKMEADLCLKSGYAGLLSLEAVTFTWDSKMPGTLEVPNQVIETHFIKISYIKNIRFQL